MATEFNDVYRSKFILLTTFTKDGRAKPTPVRGTPEDGKLLVFTGRDSWKIKRIRNTPRVTIAACSRLGRSTSDPVDAIATVLPESQTQRVYRTRLRQAGLVGGAIYRIFTKLGGGLDNRAALEITPSAARAPA